jgi:hypothetical protein
MSKTLTIRDWVARSHRPHHQSLVGAYANGRPDFTPRQYAVLDQAEVRGFLFDPVCETLDYRVDALADPTDGGFEGLDTRGTYRWLDRLRLAGATIPRGDRQRERLVDDTREPGHYTLWRDYSAEVLSRPPVLAGRFGPTHLDEMIGVQVAGRTRHLNFVIDWRRLLALAASAMPSTGFDQWLRFDGRSLAVNVPRDEAESLAAALADILLEDGWEVRGHRPTYWEQGLEESA